MDPSAFTLNTSQTVNTKSLSTPLLTLKNGKAPVARVDLEPLYTQLKSALGDQWSDYKAAVNAFILGNLNQAELSWVLQPLFSGVPPTPVGPGSSAAPVSTLHLHNTLIVSILANIQREPPPTDIAPWVVATDKPSASSKGAGAAGINDKADERLKREAQGLHMRDRKRLKTLKEEQSTKSSLRELEAYHHELAVKPPDSSNQGTGGLARAKYDVDIRRRYAQNLAAETLEFPTQADVHNRLEPICYEEGLTLNTQQTSSQSCAELVEQALEVYLKEMLGQLCTHTRSNGEGCVQTSRFKRQLRKEEDDAERGVVQKNSAGLLPVEMEVQANRVPLSLDDMRIALSIGDTYIRSDPFLAESVSLNRYPDTQPSPFQKLGVNGFHAGPTANGSLSREERDAMEDHLAIDEGNMGWVGSAKQDQDSLMSALDDIFAIG